MNTTITEQDRKEAVRQAVKTVAYFTTWGKFSKSYIEIAEQWEVQAAVSALGEAFPVRGRHFEALARIEDTLLSEVKAATNRRTNRTDLKKAAERTFYSLADWSGNAFAEDVDGTW